MIVTLEITFLVSASEKIEKYFKNSMFSEICEKVCNIYDTKTIPRLIPIICLLFLANVERNKQIKNKGKQTSNSVKHNNKYCNSLNSPLNFNPRKLNNDIRIIEEEI